MAQNANVANAYHTKSVAVKVVVKVERGGIYARRLAKVVIEAVRAGT